MAQLLLIKGPKAVYGGITTSHVPVLIDLICVFYRPVVRTTANAAIKGRAAELSVSQFIRDRETVERELFKAVKLRLEGMFI